MLEMIPAIIESLYVIIQAALIALRLPGIIAAAWVEVFIPTIIIITVILWTIYLYHRYFRRNGEGK